VRSASIERAQAEGTQGHEPPRPPEPTGIPATRPPPSLRRHPASVRWPS
jgi:hypothetical protein